MIMAPGYVVVVWALAKSDDWPWQATNVWALTAVALLLGGYLAPAIRRLVVSKRGFALETRDPAVESTAADVHTARELEQLEASGELPGGADPVQQDEVESYSRFLAASAALDSLLNQSGGPLAGCRMHVYLWDDEREGLVRNVFEHSERAITEPPWAAGVGVVGKAWATGEVHIATGSAATDSTHGLDADQQARHADLTGVAASPIVTASGVVIGVLSASNHDPAVALDGEDVVNELVAISSAVARVLVDLLGWFVDEPMSRRD